MTTSSYVTLTTALIRQGRFALAEETCRFALSLTPSDAAANRLLAEILKTRAEVRATPEWRRFQMLRPRYLDFPRQITISAIPDDLSGKIHRDLKEIQRIAPPVIAAGRAAATLTDVPHGLPCGCWFDLHIGSNGRVQLCRFETRDDYIIGDVRRQTVLEIYNNPAFRNLRENHSAREGVDPCGGCPLLDTTEEP